MAIWGQYHAIDPITGYVVSTTVVIL